MAVTNNESSRDDVTGWAGWVYFAGLMMIITGIIQMISGLTALLHKSFYVVKDESLVVLNYTTWGWIHLGLGLIVLMAGMSVLQGNLFGRIVGVFIAMLSLIANFVFLPAYPIWSIIAITVDTLVIYALCVHGAETRVD